MSISFRCPNGHQLKVKDKYAGQTGICPHCQVRVLVPQAQVAPKPQAAAAPQGAMSDDAIADFIGPPPAEDDLPVHQEARLQDPLQGSGSGSSLIQAALSARESKICPKCKREVRICYALCPYCHMYFSDISEIVRRRTTQ